MESKKIYDIENIIKKCDSIEDKNQFINYVAEILHENQKSFLYQIYSILKKDYIIKTLEKTLKIMNEGGVLKTNINKEDLENNKDENQNNIRTIGGTFIYLVKTSDLISKDILKKIFWRNKKKKIMKKKLYKSLNKLNINVKDNNNTIKKPNQKEKEKDSNK